MDNILTMFQSDLKVKKGRWNKFGEYNYRSCEDILKAVKPLILEHGYYILLSDELVCLNNNVYVKAIVTLTNGEKSFVVSAFAREDVVRKKMQPEQLTGSASSYARKYALSGLFALDHTKDSDSTNTGESQPKQTNETTEKLTSLKAILKDLDKKEELDKAINEATNLKPLLNKSDINTLSGLINQAKERVK